MNLQELTTFFAIGVAGVAGIMSAIKAIIQKAGGDIARTVKILGFPVAWIKLVAGGLSVGYAIFLVLTGGLEWYWVIPGTLTIFASEYGASKVYLDKVIALFVKG